MYRTPSCFAVLEGAGIQGGGIEIAKVEAAAIGLADAGGQHDLDPRMLVSVFVGADAFDVGGVGQHTPRLVAKRSHCFRK
jgi:hypothetical protein